MRIYTTRRESPAPASVHSLHIGRFWTRGFQRDFCILDAREWSFPQLYTLAPILYNWRKAHTHGLHLRDSDV